MTDIILTDPRETNNREISKEQICNDSSRGISSDPLATTKQYTYIGRGKQPNSVIFEKRPLDCAPEPISISVGKKESKSIDESMYLKHDRDWIITADRSYIFFDKELAEHIREFEKKYDLVFEFENTGVRARNPNGTDSYHSWIEFLKLIDYIKEIEPPEKTYQEISRKKPKVKTRAVKPKLRKSKKFDTRKEAVIVALYEAHKATRQSGNEYGGFTYRIETGGEVKHSYAIKAGGAIAVDIRTPLPKGAIITGIFHSHPTMSHIFGDFWGPLIDAFTDPENYSIQDLIVAEDWEVPIFLATPEGTFRMYTPISAEHLYEPGFIRNLKVDDISKVLKRKYKGRYKLPYPKKSSE